MHDCTRRWAGHKHSISFLQSVTLDLCLKLLHQQLSANIHSILKLLWWNRHYFSLQSGKVPWIQLPWRATNHSGRLGHLLITHIDWKVLSVKCKRLPSNDRATSKEYTSWQRSPWCLWKKKNSQKFLASPAISLFLLFFPSVYHTTPETHSKAVRPEMLGPNLKSILIFDTFHNQRVTLEAVDMKSFHITGV